VIVGLIKKGLPQSLKRIVKRAIGRQEFPLPPGDRALVFLSADYGNLGDIAISRAQQLYLSRVLPRHSVVAIPISQTEAVVRSIRRQVSPSDIVTIVGGGNMGSLYPDIEGLRQLVIRVFSSNRVICFPQTLDWNDSQDSRDALNRITKAYSTHPEIHVFAREKISYEMLSTLFSQAGSVKVGWAPDIVLSATYESLGGRGRGAPSHGVLLCLRDDQERSLDALQRNLLLGALRETGLPVDVTDTHVGGSRIPHDRCISLLADKLSQFHSAQLIVTDRLHGMILAALAGTPCLVLPNSNHKIRQTWADWLRGVSQVRFVDPADLSRIRTLIREMLAMPRRDVLSPVIDLSNYDPLREVLTSDA